MAPNVLRQEELQTRINQLERETELLELGIVATREAKIRRDGVPIAINTTAKSIERNTRWIADLKALIDSPALGQPLAGGDILKIPTGKMPRQ
jgi:hypothetical protein